MNPSNQQSSLASIVEVHAERRWSIYHRLQDLGIPCWCKAYEPLRVQLDSPAAVLQCCQVIRQFTASRQELVDLLEVCWQKPAEPLRDT